MKIVLYLLLVCSVAQAQLSSNSAVAPSSATGSASDAQVVNELLKRVQVSAEACNQDLALLRTDKWKTDAAQKQRAESAATSIRRNLTNAVPELLQHLQAAPGSLNANFKLYRNLNALCDTFSTLVESAGAFGPRYQYDQLSTDFGHLDQLRREMADRIELLTGASDAELARLRSKVAAAAKPAPPASKIVVNDHHPKPKKKKPANPPQKPQS